MTTPGNPLSLFSQPPRSTPRVKNRRAIGRIGRWTVYEIKQGGMGNIHICGLDDSAPEFALKSFQPRLFFDSESRQAFLRELTVWLRLTGTPFIMPTLGIEEHEGRYFVVMPAVAEDQRNVSTVADLIARKAANAVEAFTVVLQIAAGLKFSADAIPGVSHGDLKPANILYNGGPVMISDFGLVSIGSADKRQLRATPGYEAPEYVVTGPTPASDIYSFGVIVSELAGSCERRKTGFWGKKSAAHSLPIVQALEKIAEACKMRDPARRPSVANVISDLGRTVLAHPSDLGELFVKTGMLHGMFREMRVSMLPQIATGLLKIDAPRQALEVLDSIKDEPLNKQILVLKGTSLSLLNRDTEAITWFEKALGQSLDEKERVNCLSEYALSLKRLGRLKDAEDIYVDLLRKVPEAQLGQIVVNLAGVYGQGGSHQKAADILTRFIRNHEDVPLAFAALGKEFEELGRYREAAAQYQRVLALAPQLAHLQVDFARICLKHLGRWEDAEAALLAAHQQGFMSSEWFLLAVVCSMVMGRKEDFEMLQNIAKRDLAAEAVKQLEKESVELTMDILRKAASQKDENEEASQQDTEEIPDLPDQGPVAHDESPEPVAAIPHQGASESEPFKPAGLPFFNIRFYMSTSQYSFDFYEHLGNPQYVGRFIESWNQFQRDPVIEKGTELRPTPLYFHLCPSCKTYILTNRDEGSRLNCRQCDVRSPTVRVSNDRTKEVLAAVHGALSKSVRSHKGLRQFLMFQPVETDPHILEEMKEICREEGFEHFGGSESPLGFFCLMNAKKRGAAFDVGREIATVSKVSLSDELFYEGETTTETDRLIRRLRMVGTVWSISAAFDPDAQNSMSLFFEGRKGELEQQCRQALEESPEDVTRLRLLIEVLRGNKKIAEAKLLSLRATIAAPEDPDSWISLGVSEKDLKEYVPAIAHLKKALDLDPLRREALVGLFLCYEKIGETESAEGIRARIEALGGPMIF
jgi:tetratricopeptide (TPR) repeat protein